MLRNLVFIRQSKQRGIFRSIKLEENRKKKTTTH